MRPGNRWERFHIQIDGNQVTVSPSKEFADLLGLELAEEGEGETPAE